MPRFRSQETPRKGTRTGRALPEGRTEASPATHRVAGKPALPRFLEQATGGHAVSRASDPAEHEARTSAAAPSLQRQEIDAGTVTSTVEGSEPRDAGADLPGGVPAPAPAPDPEACPDPLPEFPANTTYIFGGPRFDARYAPSGPEPNLDELTITHRIHIEFLPFSPALIRENPRLFGRYRGVRFTPEQRAEFAWDETEQTTFRDDFQRNVQSVWSARHTLVTNEPCFARYRATPVVNIEFVEDAESAHSKITAYKMPPDAARLRSEVSGGSEGTLESRDPSDPTSHEVAPADVIGQAGPFDFDSADINADVETDIQDAARAMRPHLRPAAPDSGFAEAACLSFTGRASSEGSRAYNEDLGERRADAVQDRLYAILGVDAMKVRHFEVALLAGERNATTDPQFRRVDIMLTLACGTATTVEQNVAAHEFGHLIGFGDEYVEEAPTGGSLPKFAGDRPSHYGGVEAAMGTETANELLVQDSGSIMSQGNEVRRGHYVYFLQAISRVTGKSWAVE